MSGDDRPVILFDAVCSANTRLILNRLFGRRQTCWRPRPGLAHRFR